MSSFSRIYPPVMRVLNGLGIDRWRARLGAGVGGGRVLEVGCGPGFQRRFLPAQAQVVGLEPDARLRAMARTRGYLDVVDGRGEALPFDDGSFEHVVISMVLCTVPDPAGTLREVRRELAPGGTFHLFEHVRAERLWLRVVQRIVRRPWAALGDGCDLCRDPLPALAAAGLVAHVEARGLGGVLLLVRATAPAAP